MTQRPTSQVATIVFGDVASSSELTYALGDLQAHLLIQQFMDRVHKSIENHNGRLAKTIGDGYLAWFYRAHDAVEHALELQLSLRASPIKHEGGQLQARVSVHSAEVHFSDTEYGGDVFGSGVNLAARLNALCDTGGIMLSDSTYGELAQDSAARSAERRQVDLKGIGEIVAWSVSPRFLDAR